MKYKLFVIFWIIVILILSAISGNDLDKVPKINIPHFDKVVHFGMYSILQYLFVLYYSKVKPKLNIITFLVYTAIFSVSYSILMEFAQTYVFEKRSGDFFDVIANTAGVITVVILFYSNILKKLHLI